MYLSKRNNGFYYIYYYQPSGKRTCISTKTRLKNEAVKFLSNFKEEIEQKRIDKLRPVSLKEYCNQFLNYSKNIHTIKTHKGYIGALNKLGDYFGDINLKDIIHSKLSEYFDNRVNTSSIYQARKDLIQLLLFSPHKQNR